MFIKYIMADNWKNLKFDISSVDIPDDINYNDVDYEDFYNLTPQSVKLNNQSIRSNQTTVSKHLECSKEITIKPSSMKCVLSEIVEMVDDIQTTTNALDIKMVNFEERFDILQQEIGQLNQKLNKIILSLK